MSDKAKEILMKNWINIAMWIFAGLIFVLKMNHSQDTLEQQAARQEKQLESIQADLKSISEFKTTIAVMDVKLREIEDIKERLRQLENQKSK